MSHDSVDTSLLKKPDFRPFSDPGAPAAQRPKQQPQVPVSSDVTFRSVVEDYAAQHNLLVVPTGKTHEKSRMPLYKISPNVDGKGGVAVYLLDDAVWAAVDGEGTDFRAVGLDTLVLRAARARR